MNHLVRSRVTNRSNEINIVLLIIYQFICLFAVPHIEPVRAYTGWGRSVISCYCDVPSKPPTSQRDVKCS